VIGARPTGVAAALALALGTAHVAHSNGRYPTSMSVAFRPGDRDAIYLATTFGLLIGGADGRFRWVCEANLGYEGRFDPKYRIAADGTIYLSTYKGLRLSKDGGCTFTTATAELPAADPSYLANRWIEAVDVAANGDVWIATADAGQENEVWRSTDGAARFTPTGNRSSQIWWKSLVVAPSDPTRVYVTGYQVSQQLDDAGLVPASVHLRVTRDAGGSWDQLPLTGVTLGASPLVFVDAVAPDDPDLVFLHSDRAGSPSRDRLYRSADGGLTFTEVLATTDAIRAVVIRAPRCWSRPRRTGSTARAIAARPSPRWPTRPRPTAWATAATRCSRVAPTGSPTCSPSVGRPMPRAGPRSFGSARWSARWRARSARSSTIAARSRSGRWCASSSASRRRSTPGSIRPSRPRPGAARAAAAAPSASAWRHSPSRGSVGGAASPAASKDCLWTLEVPRTRPIRSQVLRPTHRAREVIYRVATATA
jgi:hypothetical protein